MKKTFHDTAARGWDIRRWVKPLPRLVSGMLAFREQHGQAPIRSNHAHFAQASGLLGSA